jgi:hypothetical protein
LNSTSRFPLRHATAPALRDKALQLLRAAERLPYDPTHALTLCAARSFTPGIVLL